MRRRSEVTLGDRPAGAGILSPLPAQPNWLLFGTFVSSIGNGMHTLATGALLFEATGSVTAFAALIVFEQIVAVASLAGAGPCVDRSSPTRIAVLAEAVRGSVVLLLSALVMSATVDLASAIVVMTLVIRGCHGLHRAATFAMVPRLVQPEHLDRLNSRYSAAQQGGQLLGLALTGLFLASWGALPVYAFNGLSFLVSAVALTQIGVLSLNSATDHCEEPAPSWKSHVVSDWLAFLSLISRAPRLLVLIATSIGDNITLALFNLALAPLVAMRMAGEPGWLSWLASAHALGALASSFAAPCLMAASGKWRVVCIGFAGQAIGFFALDWLTSPALITAAAVVIGIFNTLSWTAALCLVQAGFPNNVHGRLAVARSGFSALAIAPLVPVFGLLPAGDAGAPQLLVSGAICLGLFVIAVAYAFVPVGARA